MYYRIRENYHLGDRWARLNYALRLLEAGESFSLFVENPFSREVIDALAISHLSLTLLPEEPVDQRKSLSLIYRISSIDAYHCRYFATKVAHNPHPLHIGYSIDARWRKEDKVPPGIRNTLKELGNVLPGHLLVPIGNPYQQSLSEVICTMAKLTLLISVDNGIAHVARSVGVPLILLEYRHPVERGFPVDACRYTRVTQETLIEQVLSIIHAHRPRP